MWREGIGIHISGDGNRDRSDRQFCAVSGRLADDEKLSFFKVYEEHQLEYILIVKSNNDDNYLVGKMAVFQLQGLLVAYRERFDKDNFIKNLLLDNLLLVDIYNRAKKLHIDIETRRLVFIVETDPENSGSLESIRSLFGTKSGDFITAVDEKSIIIVKEVGQDEDYAEMNKVAAAMLDAVGEDDEGKTHVAYGTIVKELKDVSRSYKEAKMAMDVVKSSRTNWISMHTAHWVLAD